LHIAKERREGGVTVEVVKGLTRNIKRGILCRLRDVMGTCSDQWEWSLVMGLTL